MEFLKSVLFPHIEYTLKGFILRIPTIHIHNWYREQSNFHNPFILDFLDQCRLDFGLVDGVNHEAFQLIRLMEHLSKRELQNLAIPCDVDRFANGEVRGGRSGNDGGEEEEGGRGGRGRGERDDLDCLLRECNEEDEHGYQSSSSSSHRNGMQDQRREWRLGSSCEEVDLSMFEMNAQESEHDSMK